MKKLLLLFAIFASTYTFSNDKLKEYSMSKNYNGNFVLECNTPYQGKVIYVSKHIGRDDQYFYVNLKNHRLIIPQMHCILYQPK